MNQIIVAVIAMIGTTIGSFAGIIASAKLTNYRLSQLEKKVDVHNNFACKIPILEERIRVLNDRVNELEGA